jgi:hypothetical protein
MKPRPAKPSIIIAHVEGSGTAVFRSYPIASMSVISAGEKPSTWFVFSEWLNASRVSPAQSLRSPPDVPLNVLRFVAPESIEKYDPFVGLRLKTPLPV